MFETLAVTRDTSVRHFKEMMELLKSENPIIYDMIDTAEDCIAAQEIPKMPPEQIASFYYVHGMMFVYWLLRSQAEIDDLNKTWGD